MKDAKKAKAAEQPQPKPVKEEATVQSDPPVEKPKGPKGQ